MEDQINEKMHEPKIKNVIDELKDYITNVDYSFNQIELQIILTQSLIKLQAMHN